MSGQTLGLQQKTLFEASAFVSNYFDLSLKPESVGCKIFKIREILESNIILVH